MTDVIRQTAAAAGSLARSVKKRQSTQKAAGLNGPAALRYKPRQL